MKKKELLKILAGRSICQDLCNIYYEKISDVLTGVSEDTEINGISLLETKEFKNSDAFERFLRNNDGQPEVIERKLYALYEGVRSFVLKNSAQKTAIHNLRKGTFKRVIIVSALLLTIVLGIIIVSILSWANVISEGLAEKLSTAFGTLDVVLGIVFFVYEIINDKIKGDEINEGNEKVIQKYVNEGIVNSKVKAGKGATVIGNSSNGGAADEDEED